MDSPSTLNRRAGEVAREVRIITDRLGRHPRWPGTARLRQDGDLRLLWLKAAVALMEIDQAAPDTTGGPSCRPALRLVPAT